MKATKPTKETQKTPVEKETAVAIEIPEIPGFPTKTEAQAPKAAKAPKAPKEERYTRLHATADALNEGIQNKTKIVERASKLFLNHNGGQENRKEAADDCYRAFRLLRALGAATETAEEFILTKSLMKGS